MTQKEIGKCIFCGEPVEGFVEEDTEEVHHIFDGGTIEMSFGYGSTRDTEHVQGFIHDLCSAKLEKLFKIRPVTTAMGSIVVELDLDKTLKENRIIHKDIE